MKAKLFLGVLLAAAALASPAQANSISTGFISILGEDGKAYNLNVATGVASFAAALTDPPGSSEQQYSPNALGVSGGSYFYASYNTGNAAIYRDANATPIFTTGISGFNIQNADAVGSNYYFVNRTSGNFHTIAGIFGPSPSQTLAAITGISVATMGDLAVLGSTAYLSMGTTLYTFDITNPGTGFGSTKSIGFRFVGMGFDGGSLYGVRRVGDNNFDLYSINTSTLAATLLYDITGIPTTGGAVTGQYEITDGSRAVPIPAAAWLLGSGIVGLVVHRRTRKK